MQQLAKLDDMASGIAPQKDRSLNCATPSDEVRDLTKQVSEAKKAGGFTTTDPATQLKTALETAKTRLTNQITDLQREIDTKTRIFKAKSDSRLRPKLML